jgi:hypothetical protein
MTQRMDYAAAAPGGMKALGSVYGYVSQSELPATLIDLVYLRFPDQWLCILHRHAQPRSAKGGRADREACARPSLGRGRAPVQRPVKGRTQMGRGGHPGQRHSCAR